MVNYPAEFVVLVCSMLAGEIIIGLSLNLYIMIRWYTDRAHQASKNKRNGNNFIITLKFIDLIICASVIPFAFTVLIVNSENNLVVCFIKEGLVMFASSGSSFCVLLISVDRYVAVVWPTKHLLTPCRIMTCKFTAVLFALIGLILPLLSLTMPSLESAKAQSVNILPCRHVVWIFKPYFLYEIYYIVSFLIAVITTFMCYHSVLKVVRRRLLLRKTTLTSSSAAGKDSRSNVDRFRKQELKATRVAFAVVVSFLVCWGPHVIITVVQFSFVDSIVVDMIQCVCLVMAFLAPIIHPLIYTYENNDSKVTVPVSGPAPLRVAWPKGGSRVTPEETNVDSFIISGSEIHVLDQTNVKSIGEENRTANKVAEHVLDGCLETFEHHTIGNNNTVVFYLSNYTEITSEHQV